MSSSKKAKISKVKNSQKTLPVKTAKTNKKALPVKKIAKSTQVPVPVVQAPPPVQKSEAEKIWDDIKNLPIQIYGLVAQIVGQHCTPVPVEPTKLYVVGRAPAFITFLETAIAPRFEVEVADKFIVVKRAVKPLGSK